MRKRGSGETPPGNRINPGIYKSLAIRSSELMARVRDKSSRVVYKGIVKELAI